MTDQLEGRTPATAQPATAQPRPRRRSRPAAVVLLAAATVGAGVWYLTPTSLGGSTSYLVTQGTSMLPTHEPGALVLARAQDDYQVGDVIAFNNEGLHDLVMHRIVGVDGDRYVTQGDNNAAEDAFRPGPADVVGKAWVELPRGAEVMSRIRSPLVQAVVWGTLAVLALLAGLQRRRPD